jgi:hypothetical protein
MVSFNMGLAGTLPMKPAINVTSNKTILNIFHHDCRSIVQCGGKNRERILFNFGILRLGNWEIAVNDM